MPSPVSKTVPYAVVGIILSLYALYVEHKVAHKSPDEEFTALCDIQQLNASCSAVFQLPEGRMLSYFGVVPEGSLLDIPNAGIGFIYYFFWLFLSKSFPSPITILASSLAMASSAFLAIRLLILGELCVLCWSTHVINGRLFWSMVVNLVLGGGAKKKKEKVIKRV